MTHTLPSPDAGPRRFESEARRPLNPSSDKQRVDDERVFAALFLDHYASLCEFVDAYIRAPDVAEELVQAVFLRLWESRRS